MKRTVLRVGTGPACEIRLHDTSVSALHAEVELAPDGSVFIVDCLSEGGTALLRAGRAMPITQNRARAGDVLRFGRHEVQADVLVAKLKAHLPAASPADTSTAPRKMKLSSRKRTPSPPDDNVDRCEVCGHVKTKDTDCPVCRSC